MYFGSFLRIESWVFEIVLYLFFVLVLWAGRKILGREKTSLFLWGSLLWTLVVENVMVVIGTYDYFAYANYYCWADKFIPGFSGWAVMVFFVPLSISLGWFLFSLPAIIISERLLPKSNIWVKAAVAAIMLVSLDMLMDPISVANEWWRWTAPSLYIRGVCIGNYIGWFFMLFFYAGVYERTVIERGSFAWLKPLEKLIFKRNTSDLAAADIRTIGKLLYFRTVIYIPVMVIVTLLFVQIPTPGFNRYAPFNNVFPAKSDQQFPASSKPAGLVPVSLSDQDVRKVKGPRCEIKNGKSIVVESAGGDIHVQQ